MTGKQNPVLGFSAQPDVQDTLAHWRRWMESERNVSPHTLTAYIGDVATFLEFITGYQAKPPSMIDLSAQKPADFRAWLSKLANDGLIAASRARALAAVRNFFRWMDRSGRLHNPAIGGLSTPKVKRPVPRPLTVLDADRLLE